MPFNIPSEPIRYTGVPSFEPVSNALLNLQQGYWQAAHQRQADEMLNMKLRQEAQQNQLFPHTLEQAKTAAAMGKFNLAAAPGREESERAAQAASSYAHLGQGKKAFAEAATAGPGGQAAKLALMQKYENGETPTVEEIRAAYASDPDPQMPAMPGARRAPPVPAPSTQPPVGGPDPALIRKLATTTASTVKAHILDNPDQSKAEANYSNFRSNPTLAAFMTTAGYTGGPNWRLEAQHIYDDSMAHATGQPPPPRYRATPAPASAAAPTADPTAPATREHFLDIHDFVNTYRSASLEDNPAAARAAAIAKYETKYGPGAAGPLTQPGYAPPTGFAPPVATVAPPAATPAPAAVPPQPPGIVLSPPAPAQAPPAAPQPPPNAGIAPVPGIPGAIPLTPGGRMPPGTTPGGMQPRAAAPDANMVPLSKNAQQAENLLRYYGAIGDRAGVMSALDRLKADPTYQARERQAHKMGDDAALLAQKQGAGTGVVQFADQIIQNVRAWQKYSPSALAAATGPFNNSERMQNWTGWSNSGGFALYKAMEHDINALTAQYRDLPSSGKGTGSDQQDATFNKAIGEARDARDPDTLFAIMKRMRDLIITKAGLPHDYKSEVTPIDPENLKMLSRHREVGKGTAILPEDTLIFHPGHDKYVGLNKPAAQAATASPLDEARSAIARGAPRDKVIERLRQSGIDPAGL